MTSSDTKNSTKLLQRALEERFACLCSPMPGLDIATPGLEISTRHFLNHVEALACNLPPHRYFINLCDNRYLFTVAFCAAVVSGRTTLLPPNKNAQTQAKLANDYSDCLLIHDNQAELAALDELNLLELDWLLSDVDCQVPEVDPDFLAAISFTSGSTGDPKANLKSWQTIVESSAINARYMLLNPDINHTHLATVPGQHMWGFETSVLLALFNKVTLVDARPFFPADILKLSRNLPKPCSLISTPLHLKNLSSVAKSSTSELELASILCATAPLDLALAKTLEDQFNTQVREVYGCSEVGSMAVRRTAHDQVWQAFDGLNFATNGNTTEVSAKHLPVKNQLEDQLKFTSEGKFTLVGRTTDQIKIAGKRGSLSEANAILNKFEGLIDGVVIFPDQDRTVPRLVALVVLESNHTIQDLRKHMAEHLDAAFIPRPIFQVESLPREENGKLGKQKVMALYQSLLR